MSTRAAIQQLIETVAPTSDTAWEWLRKLHEAGYELRSSGSLPMFLATDGVLVMPIVERGAVHWIAAINGTTRNTSDPRFNDPMAAAVWWEIEKGNRQTGAPAWPDTAAPIPQAPPQQQMIYPATAPWNVVGQPATIPGVAPSMPMPTAPVKRGLKSDPLTAGTGPRHPRDI
ncbi:hypothetical protein D3C81_895190 [compost metagenome]